MKYILTLIGALIAYFGFENSSKADDIKITSSLSDNWTKYDRLFKLAAFTYNVDWKWLKAIALNETLLKTESRTAQGLVSSDGKSYGIMQFTLSTAKDMYGTEVTAQMLNNDEFSINLAGKYVSWLSREFNDNMENVIKSYNQGIGNTKLGKTYANEYYARFLRWLEKINISED